MAVINWMHALPCPFGGKKAACIGLNRVCRLLLGL